MAYFAVFFIALFTISGVVSFHCTDQQLPASGIDISGPQQVIALQYCTIDDCTIMMIATGEKLDIVYTTDSLIMATSTNGQTSVASSVVIAMIHCVLCLMPWPPMIRQTANFIGQMVQTTLIMAVSAYITVIHAFYKELLDVFEMTLMFHSLSVVAVCMTIITIAPLHFKLALHCQMLCHGNRVAFMLAVIAIQVYATRMLHYLAYIMHYSYKLRASIPKSTLKFFFRCYTKYAMGTLMISLFLIVCYDLATDKGRHTILPTSHCAYINDYSYNTAVIVDADTAVNKVAQITAFIAYLYYFYKFQDAELSNNYDKRLSIIALGMGAAIGISQIFYTPLLFDTEYDDAASIVGTICLFIQQCIIAVSLRSKYLCKLCKKR